MIKELIEKNAVNEGLNTTGIGGVELYKMSVPYSKCATVMKPTICIIGQGSKSAYLGDKVYKYDENTLLIGSLRMPIESELHDASPQKPYLGLIIYLDPVLVSELLIDYEGFSEQIDVSRTEELIVDVKLTSEIRESVIRLLKVVGIPADEKILGKSLVREVYYSVLKSPIGHMLRNSAIQHSKAHQVAPVIRYLEKHLAEDVQVDDLAKQAGMSASTLHETFKKATSLPPMQFLKRLRLHNAHTLLLSGNNASEAASNSGYNSPAQFSREFKRLYGISPSAIKTQSA